MGLAVTDEVYGEDRNVAIPYWKQSVSGPGLSASTLMVKVCAAGSWPGLAELP